MPFNTTFVNYKIWVPPTKLFFGSKVILQIDNGPRVQSKALKDQMRISLGLLNNHEILLAISTRFYVFFIAFARQIICPAEQKHTPDGPTF